MSANNDLENVGLSELNINAGDEADDDEFLTAKPNFHS